jgi:lipoprotein-anchoring transpeptidase ErfK/SrfK
VVKPQVGQSSLFDRNVNEPNIAIPQKSSVASSHMTLEANYPHIRVDLRRQILSVVDASGNVLKVLPVSTGSGRWYTSEGERRKAVTPRGRFTVYRKISGWRKSPLGLMYYPVYIVGGIAIHGSPSVPRTPASHGCVRIPMYAAKAFHDSTPIGTTVHVY